MNYKHTRGEWVVNPPFKNDNKIFISNGENVIAYMAHNPSVNIDEEAEANAKLIASAPKLLENEIKNLDLLEWFLSKSREFNMWSDKIQVLQNRISETKLVITNATTV